MVGKIAIRHLPLVRELRLRGVIRPPRLLPRLADGLRARSGWRRSAEGATVLDLLKVTMRIAFVVNEIETEKSSYTTTRLAYEAHALGHEAWYMAARTCSTTSTNRCGLTRVRRLGAFRDLENYLAAVKGETRGASEFKSTSWTS